MKKRWYDRKPGECRHRKTTILKKYRNNYPFGRKSKPKHYEPPLKCTEFCNGCGKKLRSWKPS